MDYDIISLKYFIPKSVLFCIIYFFVKYLSASHKPSKSPSLQIIFFVIIFALFSNIIIGYFVLTPDSLRNMSDLEIKYYSFYNPIPFLWYHLIILFICFVILVLQGKDFLSSIVYQAKHIRSILKWVLYVLFIYTPVLLFMFKIGLDYQLCENKPIYILSNPLLIYTIVGVVGPVSEELMFRGIIYTKLKESIGAAWSIIISSIIFSLFHGNINVAIYVVVFVSSVVYCIGYEKGKSLLVPIGMHCIANISRILLMTKKGMILFATLPDNITISLLIVPILSFFAIRFFVKSRVKTIVSR